MPPNSSTGGGSSPVSAQTYQPVVETPYLSVVLGVNDPETIADFVYTGPSLMDTFEDAIFGGSPYALVEAYNPDTAIDRIRDRFEDFKDAVADHDPNLDLQAAMERAAAVYDAEVDTTTTRNAAIVNFLDRQENAFARAVSRTAMDHFTIRGIMSTQATMAMANLEADRALEQTEYESRFDLATEERRANAIISMAGQWLQQKALKTEGRRTVWALEMEASRLEVTLKQDETEFNLEMEARDALYDLDLYPHFFGAMSAINGGTLSPRAQTRRERIAASFQIATSTALQVGSTMGPAAGGVAGVLNFATQMWALGGER